MKSNEIVCIWFLFNRFSVEVVFICVVSAICFFVVVVASAVGVVFVDGFVAVIMFELFVVYDFLGKWVI